MTNNTSFEKATVLLAEEIGKHRMSVFVGAGCSMPAGLPAWDALIKDLLKKYNIKTKERNLLRLASRLERELGALKFREELIELLKVSPEITTPACNTLVSLGINSYITTNYDHVLENSFRSNGFDPVVIYKDEDLPSINPTQKYIVKLHGDINSPSSLIITSKDYTKYKSMNRGFIEWLTADMSRNTVLFLGTSFDDPRLVEVDDHIINLFYDLKRRHFILLKKPDPTTSGAEDYNELLGDFEAICEDFNDRGFFVVQIEEYEEIEIFLQTLHKKVLSNNLKKDPADLKSTVILQSKQIGNLEETLSTLLDSKTRELCAHVRGNGRLPTSEIMLERVKDLIKHLENPPAPLLPESQVEGWITVTDAYISSNKKDRLIEAKKSFEKAQFSFKRIEQNSKEWQERLLHLQARILFADGEIDEAASTLENSSNNKAISLWLAFLIDSDRLEEACDYISNHTVKVEWLNIALYSFVLSGKIQDAEQIFLEKRDEIKRLSTNGKLANSSYENEYFYEKMCFAMANAFYLKALKTSENDLQELFHPDDIGNDEKRYLLKSLYYIELLVEKFKHGGEYSYYYVKGRKIELSAAYLLQDHKRADKIAIELVVIYELSHDIIEYLLSRRRYLAGKFDFRKLAEKLKEKYSDKVWALVNIADIEVFLSREKNDAWLMIQKAAGMADSTVEKENVARSAFGIGQLIGETTNANLLINDILPEDNLWRIFLSACFFMIDEKYEEAEQLFLELEQKQAPLEIQAKIKAIKGNQAIENKKWREAKVFLEESIKIRPDIYALKDLLRVQAMLQDDQAALNIAKTIESRGLDDEQVTAIKAQAARNLNLFNESERAYRKLVHNHPERPEYAYHLAETLFQLDNLEEALNIIQPFIDCNKMVDFDCLRLACELYSMRDEDEKSIKLLETCFEYIQDEPLLLLRHLELYYRTSSGAEKESPKSLSRLQILKQQGKIDDELFSMKGIDDLVEILNKRHETAKKIDDAYRHGKLVRQMLCEWHNRTLYLDWAVRTQELSLDSENPLNWIKYTVYATNGMRVDLFDEKNQLMPFVVPLDIKEIVIDYHALITVHRLGLLEQVSNTFSKVFYPHILQQIWRVEHKQFKHHQRSKEIIYHSLHEKLRRGQLTTINAPDAHEKQLIEDDSFIKRNIRLAYLEKFPILDGFTEEKDLVGYKDVYRISQFIKWIYSKGKITETQFKDFEKIQVSSSKIIKQIIGLDKNQTNKLLVEKTTLEILEQYGFIQSILDLGVQIIVEKATADYFHIAVSELRFGKKVGNWHKDLAKTVKNLKSFQTVTPQSYPQRREQLTDSPYLQSILDCLLTVESKKVMLLSDDRWMQMATDQQHRNKSFGSDVLLKFLYEKEIISLETYADKFLQLCKWRYRFLIPDKRILVYFAKEYKENPSGDALRIIGNYGRSCMEDPGLFMGPEPTEPPLPLGLKLQMKWVTVWTEFLCLIWQDDDFSTDSLEQFSQDVYMRFLPDLPPNLDPSIRKNVGIVHKDSVVMTVFISAMNSTNPSKLNGLLNQLFVFFQYDEERRNNAISLFLESISQNVSTKNHEEQVARKVLANNVLTAFYGDIFKEKGKVDLSLVSILKKLGFSFSSEKNTVTKDPKITNAVPKGRRHFPFQRRSFHRRNMPEYIPDGPLIITKAATKKSPKILIPHYSIRSPMRSERLDVLTDILSREDVSNYSKKLIKRCHDRITSSDEISWRSASKKITNILLSDFTYSSSLFHQLVLLQNPDVEINKLVNEAWTSVVSPDLNSVNNEYSLLLCEPIESYAINKKINRSIAEFANATMPTLAAKDNILHALFDWYLEKIYFVPIAPPLNPSSILMNAISTLKDRDPWIMSCTEIFHAVESWVKDKVDPFALLMSIELILYARTKSDNTEKVVFSQEKFYSLFDSIFEKLLSLDDATVPASMKMMKAVWEMRKNLTRYFLMYLDLHDDTEMTDDKKVPMAWWMAREVCRAIVASVEIVEGMDSSAWIEKQTSEVLARQGSNISFTHRIADRRKFFSLGRYYTLAENHSVIAVATLAIFWPGTHTGELLLNSLKKPTTILPPEIRNMVINHLSVHTILGDGQLQESDQAKLSFLWDIPLCKTATMLLREYYGDAIDLLGDEKLKLIEFAEVTSTADFLEKGLCDLPEHVKEKADIPIIITLSALRSYILSTGKLPDTADIFKRNKRLAIEISKFNNEYGWTSIFLLAQILIRLYAADNYKWASIFGGQLSKIDYEHCRGKILEQIINALVEASLMGYSYSILKPILKLKSKNKEIRESLGLIKSSLEYAFPRIPAEYQENARKILNDLVNIPTLQPTDLYEDE